MGAKRTVVAVALAVVAFATPAGAAPSPEVIALRVQVNALKTELRAIKKDIKALGKDADKAARSVVLAKSQADLAVAKTNCLVNVVPTTWWTNFVFITDGAAGLGTGMDIAVGADQPRVWLAGVNPSCVPTPFPSYFSTVAPPTAASLRR